MDERQWLLSNPVVWIVAPVILVAIGGAGWGLWQEEARSAWLLVLPAFGLAMLLFGYLRIRATDAALVLSYFPVWRRRIPWSDIRDAHAVRYEAWRYGGWGIRFSKGTVAYSVWSKDAIRFSVVGRRLDVVVTTRRPEAWLAELDRRSRM